MRKAIRIVLTGCIVFMGLTVPDASRAEEQKPTAPPPMLVGTAEVISGQARPSAPYVGTVYFARTAAVAAEVDGVVKQTFIDDGQPVRRGAALVKLDDDLLAADIAGTEAAYAQNQVDLEQAGRDFARIEALHQQGAIATSEFESYRSRVQRLEQSATALKARLDRIRLEQAKKTVRAPFAGRVIEVLVEDGEWVKVGGTVATLADDRKLELRVDLPADIVALLSEGQQVTAKVAGQKRQATFLALIPRGDIATRTFVAKFGLDADPALIEGMQAELELPTAAARESLVVPRDAIIDSFGQTVIFINDQGTARMLPVTLTGYDGDRAGISGAGLVAGQQVIIKGNERIRDGQPVRTE
jgi:RND family efflux transporter MFP subunit